MTMTWTGDAQPGRPYWWDARAMVDPAELPAAADLLVIGGGYTGLSAAIAAADAGAKVVVVDAGQPGEGASTRNGGMVGAHPRLAWEDLSKLFGAQVADGIFAEAAPALAWMRALVTHEGIACDWQDTGRIQLAFTPAHAERQKRLAARVREKSTVPVRILSRSEVEAEIATPLYHGAMLFPDHAALHPAKFHAGLLAAARKRGVTVIPDCPVTGLSGGTATTPLGRIAAPRIVLATGGYTTTRFRWHQRRVFPLPSYIVATEPVAPERLARLAPGRRMMVETRARFSYFRLSPDGRRILFGGRAAMVPVSPERAAARQRETMLQIWPDLEDIRLSYSWSGNTGYSFTHMPHVGEAEGVHYAMGFSGSGTVLAPWLGAKAAYRALGDPRGETAYAGTPLRPSWMHRFSRPWFLYPADLWYRHSVDPRETRKAQARGTS